MANTLAELQQLQALPLDIKIRKTEQRIKEWVDYYGLDGVAVSFSGGKDSTVLMDIARRLYPSIKAVFVDIPTQYPELKQFVKTYDNVDIIRPKKNFFQVCEEYGFPLISKEVSESVQGARKYLTELLSSEKVLTDRQTDRQTDSCRISISTNELQERENTVNFRKPSLLLTKYQKKILVGGGYDRKYRRVRGIGEFAKRTDEKPKRWEQPEISNHARMANKRQPKSCSDKCG